MTNATIDQDFELWQGDHRVIEFSVAGVGDLGDYYVEWALTPEPGIDALVVKTSDGAGITLANGIAEVVLEREDTLELLAPRVYHHELRITGDGGEGVVTATGRMWLHASTLGAQTP